MKNFKKLLLTGTFTAVTLFAMSITANAATTIKVTADTLNIRKGPSIDTQVVAMLSKGVECEVIGEEGNWYQIKYQDYKGYVSKEYVEITSQTSNNKESNNSEEEENTQQENNNEQNNQENNSELQNQEQKENTQENNNTQTEEKNNEEQNNKEETEAPKIIYQKFTKNTDVKIIQEIGSNP